MHLPNGPTQLVSQLLEQKLSAGDFAVDATAGNGHDTLTLAKAVGSSGRVWATDIQAEAIEQTRIRLHAHAALAQVELLQLDHAQLHAHLPEEVKGKLSAIVFNLGYLPGANHQQVTQAHSTMAALNTLLPFLAENGICMMSLYRGHEGGLEEAKLVEAWTAKLQRKQWLCWRASLTNVSAASPYSLILQRLNN